MSLKIKIPEPGSERLSWCKNIPISVCMENGMLEGSVNALFVINDANVVDEILDDEANSRSHEFIKTVLREVNGIKDENGEEYPPQVQLDFCTRELSVVSALNRAYWRHVAGGDARKSRAKAAR